MAGIRSQENTALVAHEMGADHHFAAAAVFWSTVLSMVTVTVLIVILRLPSVAGGG